MDVFISWSGERSGKVAEALHHWLPSVIQSVSPFMSASDIEKGSRWSPEIANRLEKSQFGLICLTPEDLEAPWLLFEAGALSKSIGNSRVVPYLYGVSLAQLQGPLTQFQVALAEKEPTRDTIRSINTALGDKGLEASRLERSFEAWWPDLEKSLQIIPAGGGAAAPPRSDREILEEILGVVRQVSRQSTEELPEIQSSLRNLQSIANHSLRSQRGRPISPELGVTSIRSENSVTVLDLIAQLLRNPPETSQDSETTTPLPEEEDEGE